MISKEYLHRTTVSLQDVDVDVEKAIENNKKNEKYHP